MNIKTFYERVMVLGLLKTFSRVSVTMVLRSVKGGSIRDAKEFIDDTLNNWVLVDTMLIRKSDLTLISPDRVAYLTENFLSRCDPDWANTLREAIDKIKAEAA